MATQTVPPQTGPAEPDLPAQGMPRVATAIAVVAWGTAVLAGVLTIAARPPVDVGTWFFFVDAMVAVVYGTTAWAILSRRNHPVPWILAVTAIGGGLAALGYAWAVFVARNGGFPELEQLVRLQNTAWVPGTLALFLVVPWLVRDHPLGWERLGLGAGIALIAVTEYERYARDGAWDRTMFTATVVLGVVTAAVVEWRHRFGPAAERNGLGWLAVGTLVMALSFVPLTLPVGFDEQGRPTVDLFGGSVDFLDVLNLTPALHLAAQAVFPAAILVAVLRGRMWGLDLAVSRATLAAVLTLGLVLTYLAVNLLVAHFVPGDGLPQLAGAAAIAVAVQPARLRVEARVNTLVYGAASTDPTRLVLGLGSKLGVEGDLDDLFAGLARDLGTGLRLESVTVRAEGIDDVRWGTPTSAPTTVPLLHRGQAVGTIEVTAPAGEILGARGERLVADFGAVAAAALVVRAQAHEVDRARARLTRARLEERRVIRREIHDGLGPSLAGLRLGLQGARNLLGRDDEAAARILEQLQLDLDQRVAEVRTLSHSLLPPVLDELGLAPALEELSARYAENGVVVGIRADVPDGLPAAVAVAAYGITSEALVNAHRHGAAGRCRVVALVQHDSLVVTIEDDGTGIAADAVPGVGTQAMRERAEELGGRVEVGPRPGGGTVVRADLPLVVAGD
ncbi:histidine kinase [Marmoricola sp. RAF53]|uniref:sensor histidine kinase n=1 Tax=Marmoricola sp. RAF53 TaxID=3233059 RepID=UPI003F97B668